MTARFAGLRRLDLRATSTREAEAAREAWTRLCGRACGLEGEAERAARAIIDAVRREGDAAVIRLTRQFEDRELRPERLEIPLAEARAALARLPPPLAASLRRAGEQIRAFHRTQVFGSTGVESDGVRLTSRARPLRRVAVYAPGGTAAYPSSVLMAAIPAKVAGVDEVILLTPRPSEVVLAAAALAGVDRIFAIGGAQGIAAAAFGTATVPRVDKIVGPGNAFVTAAKRLVFGHCDIDGIAGPSEILVVADEGADPRLVAADLISQAEHDVLASPVLLTDSTALADAVDAALAGQLADLPRAAIASRALTDHGAAVLVDDRAAMICEADAFAAEHLELLVADPREMADRVRAAGAIFVGPWTPEAAGDYTAGPSHVLPTAGAARFGSPLGVWDFIKYTSVLEFTPAHLRAQASDITALARAEGLEGHARSVELRLAEGPAAAHRGESA